MFRVSGKKLIKGIVSFKMNYNFFIGILVYLLVFSKNTKAQFAPPAGQSETTAMYKDSSAFVAWANAGKIIRGYMDISSPSLGYANVGDSSSAFGMAGATGVVSLGDGGAAILQFSTPIIDGSGPDFAVFENGFDDLFLELAFVEVSSDGINYFRFPATSNTDTTTQTGSFGWTDATKINNLAGKYRGLYGTPFDLGDIPDNGMLNKQAVTHVKVIDVVGCMQDQFATRDMNHHKINDPWPTGFGSGGFDLDAVGVIHQQTVGIEELTLQQAIVYPNPAKDELFVSVPSFTNYSLSIKNLVGETVLLTENATDTTFMQLGSLTPGIYILSIACEKIQKQIRFVKL